MIAAPSRADGPQSQDVVGGKVIGLRGFPLAAVNPKNMQALVYDAVQGLYIPSASGLAGAGGSSGQIQINIDGTLQGVTVGPGLVVTNGTLTTNLSAAQVCFAVGPLNGDLTGDLCNPQLAPGAAARSVGQLGGALTGSLPNPDLDPASVFNALGVPGGDLSGSSWLDPRVSSFQGYPIDSSPPTPGSSLVWNGSIYAQTVFAPGISQITGDVIAGPGSGPQVASIVAGAVTNDKLASEPFQTVKGNPLTANGGTVDIPVTGGLAFVDGALRIDPNLGFSGPKTIGSECFSYNNGALTRVSSGTCSGGVQLTADDGSTVLTADDATTPLTADGSTPPSPCGNATGDASDPCNVAIAAFASRQGTP